MLTEERKNHIKEKFQLCIDFFQLFEKEEQDYMNSHYDWATYGWYDDESILEEIRNKRKNLQERLKSVDIVDAIEIIKKEM